MGSFVVIFSLIFIQEILLLNEFVDANNAPFAPHAMKCCKQENPYDQEKQIEKIKQLTAECKKEKRM